MQVTIYMSKYKICLLVVYSVLQNIAETQRLHWFTKRFTRNYSPETIYLEHFKDTVAGIMRWRHFTSLTLTTDSLKLRGKGQTVWCLASLSELRYPS